MYTYLTLDSTVFIIYLQCTHSCNVCVCIVLYRCIFALLGDGCFNLIVHVYSDNKGILILT